MAVDTVSLLVYLLLSCTTLSLREILTTSEASIASILTQGLRTSARTPRYLEALTHDKYVFIRNRHAGDS